MFFDLTQGPLKRRSLLNEIVAPRPIAWISTISNDGIVNLAPFSHFNLVSTAPAMLMFACNTPVDRPEKDTIANVRATGEFVVNIVGRSLAEAMVQTSAPLPRGEDEFEAVGLDKLQSRLVAPPRITGAPAALECRLHQIVTIDPERDGDTESQVVFGRIIAVHLDDAAVDEAGRFQCTIARNVARVGGPNYVSTDDIFAITPSFVARD